jgi:hypothetical protein
MRAPSKEGVIVFLVRRRVYVNLGGLTSAPVQKAKSLTAHSDSELYSTTVAILSHLMPVWCRYCKEPMLFMRRCCACFCGVE